MNLNLGNEKSAKDKAVRNGWFKWWYVAILVAAVLFLIYLGVTIFYMSHFYRDTKINNVNCSNMTLAKAEEAIKAESKKYVLTLQERNKKTEQIKGSDFDLNYVLEGSLQDAKNNQNAFLWPICLFTDSEETLASSIQYNGKKFDEQIDNLSCLAKENTKYPKNAKISEYSEEDGCYSIIPEDKGSKVLKDKLVVKCKEAVQDLNATLSLEDEGCYKKVAINSEDNNLKKALKKMNRFVSAKITYEFGDKEEVLDGSKISTFINRTKTNVVSLSEDAVKEYVRDLARTYDTFGKSRKLKTSYGKTITVSGGDYGWWMNQAKESEELIKLIKDGKKKKRAPVYFQKAASYGAKDYGDTYVEINLEAQHLFYYKDGKKILESDFVSGNVSKGNATPAGLYSIMYKQHHAVLRGADYNTPVEFWMPFNGNIGMHDATWRRSFGGNIYKTSGSHGCVNMPYSNAKKLFQNIDEKTPVICYKLAKSAPASKSNKKKK